MHIFNVLFDKGIFPENWTESIVFRPYKKGDANNPNNYRGIYICDASSKLYSVVINKRLHEWEEPIILLVNFKLGLSEIIRLWITYLH